MKFILILLINNIFKSEECLSYNAFFKKYPLSEEKLNIKYLKDI